MALRTRTVNKAQSEGGDAKIEDYLISKGVTWAFRPGIAPAGFDAEKSLRNQARFVPVDENRVDSYAEAMRRGDKFPPVIAHGSRLLVMADGNHRLQAALKSHKPLDVYDITGADSTLIVQIGYESNTKHGWPTSEAERIQQALWLIDNGASARNAAAALVVPHAAVIKASATRTTDQRFRAAGIPALSIEKLNERLKVRLAQVVTDEGFVALVDLAVRASLGHHEVMRLVTEINEFSSAARQVAYVQQQADMLQDAIAAAGGGVITRKPQGPKSKIGIAMGQIDNLPDMETILAAYQGAERDEAAKRMRAAARRLNDIAKQLTA